MATQHTAGVEPLTTLLLQPEPLSAQAFAPYGEVIELSADNEIRTINEGNCDRHHDLASLDTRLEGGSTAISIFVSKPVNLPFRIETMERHPLGSQLFLPRSGHPYLVVVAVGDDLEAANIRAFIASPRQGVNYFRNTWHHYCLPLEGESEFFVVDRVGSGNNCQEQTLPRDITVLLERH